VADSIDLVAEVAFKQHEKGNLSREDLILTLKQCVNARALENGHAERYGLPFSERRDDAGDLGD
jgi:hypothetical protein